MKHYWFSATQYEIVQKFRFEAGESYIRNEVKVGNTWRLFSETGNSDKPCGKWEDYELVAKGDNLETRQVIIKD